MDMSKHTHIRLHTHSHTQTHTDVLMDVYLYLHESHQCHVDRHRHLVRKGKKRKDERGKSLKRDEMRGGEDKIKFRFQNLN